MARNREAASAVDNRIVVELPGDPDDETYYVRTIRPPRATSERIETAEQALEDMRHHIWTLPQQKREAAAAADRERLGQITLDEVAGPALIRQCEIELEEAKAEHFAAESEACLSDVRRLAARLAEVREQLERIEGEWQRVNSAVGVAEANQRGASERTHEARRKLEKLRYVPPADHMVITLEPFGRGFKDPQPPPLEDIHSVTVHRNEIVAINGRRLKAREEKD